MYSDRVLTECGGNPQKALVQIIDHFISILNKNNFVADTGAAQFYIVKQLIKCNIFPNKEVLNG